MDSALAVVDMVGPSPQIEACQKVVRGTMNCQGRRLHWQYICDGIWNMA